MIFILEQKKEQEKRRLQKKKKTVSGVIIDDHDSITTHIDIATLKQLRAQLWQARRRDNPPVI